MPDAFATPLLRFPLYFFQIFIEICNMACDNNMIQILYSVTDLHRSQSLKPPIKQKGNLLMTSDILKQYTIIAQFLGKTLGPDYEIVLHDLNPDHYEIAAIVNSHVSGRSIGGPLTNASLKMLMDKAYESDDYLCNYKGVAENGHVLRSSTMFIKDEDGKPVGLLCINFDDSRYTELCHNLLSVVHPSKFLNANPAAHAVVKTKHGAQEMNLPAPSDPITENFSMDIPSLMQKIFTDATASIVTPMDHLNQQEKKEIIEKLNKQGLFQLKGAISFVAKQFSCSSATIYRYLSELTS